MNTKEIIGRTITDIFVWSKIEVGGLDEAEVFIKLDNGKTIGIPWDFESENIENKLKKNSESLFKDLRDIQKYHINSERKSKPTFFDRIKKIFGLNEEMPKEYKPCKTEYRENKLKHLKNQKIVDFLVFDDSDSVGFIELENGYIITETIMSPHGTGMAGLNYYESLKSFEDSCGKDYKRIKNCH